MAVTVTKRHLLSCAAACALVIGCASERDVFLPTVLSTVTRDGSPGARYQLPGGSVVLAPLPLRQDPRSDEPRPLAGVRMIVSNELDPATWFVDVRDQSVTFGPPVELSPSELEELDPRADIVINRPGSDLVPIPTGKKETIDFYFPMPDPRPTEPELTRQLTMYWRVQAGPEPVARTTQLYRTQLRPVYGLESDRGEVLGRLWYDPMWNDFSRTFFYPPLIVRWRAVTPPP